MSPGHSYDEVELDEVVYDLADWDEIQRRTLEGLLIDEGVSYRWDPMAEPARSDGVTSGPQGPLLLSAELVVGERDADLVEELIDAIDHPDALEAEDDDGDDEGAEVLSALYVAADVLCGAPGHAQGAEELLDATRAAGEVDPPYGLDQATWTELGRLAQHLAGRLREGADDQVVADAARALRQAVHPLV